MALRMSLDKLPHHEFASNVDPVTDVDDHSRNITFVDRFVTYKQNDNKSLPQQQPQQPNQCQTRKTQDIRNLKKSAKNIHMMHHHDSVESSSSTTIEDICELDFGGLDSSSSASFYTISPPPSSLKSHQLGSKTVQTPATTIRPHDSINSPATITITYAKTDIHNYNTDTVENNVNEVHHIACNFTRINSVLLQLLLLHQIYIFNQQAL